MIAHYLVRSHPSSSHAVPAQYLLDAHKAAMAMHATGREGIEPVIEQRLGTERGAVFNVSREGRMSERA
jgi:hypothetical protein